MNYNYPVEYIVKKITINENNKNVTIGHVVLKCYIIESHERYLSNYTVNNTYEVFIPYDDFETFVKNKNLKDDYTIPFTKNRKFISSQKFNYIFDDYTQAKEYAIYLDMKLKKNEIKKLYNDDKLTNENYQKTNDIYNKRFLICQMFEDYVLNKTNDIKITQINNKEENNSRKLH